MSTQTSGSATEMYTPTKMSTPTVGFGMSTTSGIRMRGGGVRIKGGGVMIRGLSKNLETTPLGFITSEAGSSNFSCSGQVPGSWIISRCKLVKCNYLKLFGIAYKRDNHGDIRGLARPSRSSLEIRYSIVLSAYFVVLPLRDEGAISLGVKNLPGLFVGSLVLTFIAVPLSTLIFSSNNVSKAKGSLTTSSTIKDEVKVEVDDSSSNLSDSKDHGWFYISVRIGFFLWVALLNLITISSTWARVIDAMDNESGSRLFGFVGAGATFGQLFGSLFASTMAWLGPYLLLIASLLMELAAQSSERINKDMSHSSEELSPLRRNETDHQDEKPIHKESSLRTASSTSASTKPRFWALLEGLRLIWSSTYLLCVSLFLWLSAVTSSFFYFQKVTIIASTVASPTARRQSFAQINSFIAVFILAGQLTMTGRILTVAGVTTAICSAPFVAFLNLIAIAIWPTYVSVAVLETFRKVVTYVVTRPGRELLYTVVSQDEKYKAKVCIDVLVQRLGDATAAGMYKLLYSSLNGKTTTVSLYALPVCFLWILTGFHLGRRQAQLAKSQNLSSS
ncbi:ADP,ATP carrier protein [Tanacetum coccineum]